MNTRLQQFLELENLTPARLADMLGVQRSGLSHILSGRNKPSYEFLNKILLKFPYISAEWLMTGKGKAYKNSEESVVSSAPLPTHFQTPSSHPIQGVSSGVTQNQNSGQHPSQYPGQFQTQNPGQNQMQSHGLDVDSPILDDFDGNFLESDSDHTQDILPYSIENEVNNSHLGESELSENRAKEISKGVGGKKKRVKRVIVFYNDGSFEELFPHIR